MTAPMVSIARLSARPINGSLAFSRRHLGRACGIGQGNLGPCASNSALRRSSTSRARGLSMTLPKSARQSNTNATRDGDVFACCSGTKSPGQHGIPTGAKVPARRRGRQGGTDSLAGFPKPGCGLPHNEKAPASEPTGA
jgi:hypothetical protein